MLGVAGHRLDVANKLKHQTQKDITVSNIRISYINERKESRIRTSVMASPTKKNLMQKEPKRTKTLVFHKGSVVEIRSEKRRMPSFNAPISPMRGDNKSPQIAPQQQQQGMSPSKPQQPGGISPCTPLHPSNAGQPRRRQSLSAIPQGIPPNRPTIQPPGDYSPKPGMMHHHQQQQQQQQQRNPTPPRGPPPRGPPPRVGRGPPGYYLGRPSLSVGE